MRSSIFAVTSIFFATAASAAPLSFRDLFDPNQGEAIHGNHGVRPESETESGRDRFVGFDVLHYDLNLGIDPVGGAIGGVAKVQFKSLVDGLTEVVLDANGLQIDHVYDGRQVVPHVHVGTLLSVRLAQPLARGESGVLMIRYVAPRSQNFFVAGPDATNPGHMPAAYTYTEPEGTASWFPCLDRPEDKATTTVRLTVPTGFKALTNGDLVTQIRVAQGEYYEYRMEHPVATYLVSLAIGPYDVIDLGTQGRKKLTVWAPPAIAEAARFETSRTGAMMQAFNEFTGVEYPFNNYAQSVAEAYKTSMEHSSATTMGGWRITGDGSGEGVVAHELAHQWFGDWVTCRTWGELWLNEGFASYLPYVFFAKHGHTERALGQIDYWRFGYFEEAQERVHALSEAQPDMDNLFDSHAYEKGALVIHFIRSIVGDEAMTAALKDYLTTRGGGNGTSHDLQASFERVTGSSWQLFFDQWVRSAGHPVLSVTPEVQNSAITFKISQDQAKRAERKWRTFSFPLSVEIIDADGSTSRHVIQIFENDTTVTYLTGGNPVAVVFDPATVLPAEITVAQDASAWKAVLAHAEEATARITALRELFKLEPTVSQAVYDLVRADASTYLKLGALELWSEKSENRGFIAGLYQSIGADFDQDVAIKGALARTEEWLVSSLGQAPSRDDERLWQDRYLSSPVVAERAALLGMLKTASAERAQAFAAERIAESRWVTQDRSYLIDTLTKAPTASADAFISAALDGAAPIFLGQITRNLTAARYDRPAIVEKALRFARSHRYDGIRGAMVGLLGVQASSKDAVCPALAELATDPVVAGSVAAAKAALACGQ